MLPFSQRTSRPMWPYTVTGILIGCLFPLLAWAIDVLAHRSFESLQSMWLHYQQEPVHLILLITPCILGLLGSHIGRLRALRHSLHVQHDFTNRVLQTMDCLVIVLDRDGHVVRFNDACQRLTGYHEHDVIDRIFWNVLLPEEAIARVQAVFADLRNRAIPSHFENTWLTKNGKECLIEWSNTTLSDEHGNVTYVIGTGIDVTEQRRLEVERDAMVRYLEVQANTDMLTGTANRRYLLEVATVLLDQTRRSGGEIAVLLFDVDHFKHINDTYGHTIGDEVLQIIVARCQHNLRSSDVLGRYGGEEFMVVLPNTTIDEGQQVAERLRFAIAQAPLRTSGGPVAVTISGGLTQADQKSELGVLLESADRALYRAKNGGRNTIVVDAQSRLKIGAGAN